ncbi:MAG: oligosaccharide flippase family protein [Parabacteroides sp.]|nr:oligosaccharide flippase family protein [Parabacteroides sp.]
MNSAKQLKAGVLLSYLTLGLSNIIALVYTPFMLRMMGQSEYGLYSLAASVVAYLTVLDFGFGNAIVRYTAKYRTENKLDEQYSMFGMFLILYIGIGLISLLIGFCLYYNVDTLFNQSMTPDELSKARIMVLLLVFNVAVTFPLSIFPSIVIAYENFIFHKIVNLGRVLLQPCLMVPLLLMGYKAIGMVVLTTVLNITTLLIYSWYCFSRLQVRFYFGKFNRSLLKEISSYSFYVFLTIIVDRAFWSTGQFILGMLNGTKDVAIYSLVVQLCTYYMSFSLAISGVFLPKMTQLVTANRSPKEISDMFIKISRIQYIVMLYILIGFVLFGSAFVFYWAGPEYASVYPLTLLIMIPQTIPLIQNVGVSILQAQNRQRFRAILNFVVAVLSVFVGYLFTKKYGIVGCAVSTSLALLIGHGFILNWYYYTKIKLDILSFWKQIIKLTIPVTIVASILVGLKYLLNSMSLTVLLTEGIVYSILYFVFVWFLGCNDFEKSLISVPVSNLKQRLGIK